MGQTPGFLGSPCVAKKRPKESCPFVPPSVTQYLRIRSLLFSETLLLVRACKHNKNVPSAFFKSPFFPIFPNTVENFPLWPKIHSNGGFCAFFCNPFIRICNLFLLSLVFGFEKMTFLNLLGKFKNGPFLSKFVAFFT